jgi:ABC-2 type transport system permease protein
MFDELRKIPYFVARNFRMLYTYKLALSVSIIGIIFNLFYLVLFGSMFGVTSLQSISQYGGDFISYLLIGSIGWSFLWSIMDATSVSLSEEMRLGPFESILLTPTRLSTMMLSYSLYGCFFGFIIFVVLVSVGFFLFGISAFANASIFTLIIFVLSISMMIGFGMIFGGLTIWLKQIGETVGLLQNIVMFFCGVYFPVAVLPELFQPVAQFVPFYYSIEGLRLSLLSSTSISEIYYFIGILLVLSIFFIIVGLLVLRIGLAKAKRDGSLAFY